jgi:hypothetical protein
MPHWTSLCQFIKLILATSKLHGLKKCRRGDLKFEELENCTAVVVISAS